MKKFLSAVLIFTVVSGVISVNAEEIVLTPKEQIIKKIIQDNYNYDSKGLLKALKNGDTDCVSLFLASGTNPNTAIMKMPLIYWAIKLQKPDIVDKLLTAGVDPNQVINGKSLMAFAVSTGNAQTVRVLIKHGAKVNDISAGKSLLALALSKNSEEISNILINAGVDIDETSLSKALKLNDNALKDLILNNYKRQ